MAKTKTRKNRFKKNTRQNPGQGWKRVKLGLKLGGLVVVLLTASALFMVGYAAVTQSDFFRTQSIEVYGNSRLSTEAVIAQAMINPGDNVLAVNLHLVRKRLLAHPWIASAEVAREIPGALRISIEEHQPLAVIDLGRKFLLNTQGRIFKEYEAQDTDNLPLVTGIVYADISLGQDALTPALQAVLDVLNVSRHNTGALPYTDIEGLHFDPELGVTLKDRKANRKIKLGSSGFEEKYSCLERLLAHLEKESRWRGFKAIDINNPDRVVVQF